MAVIKARDIWKKSSLQHLDWDTFSPFASGCGISPVSLKKEEPIPDFSGQKCPGPDIALEQKNMLAEAETRAREILTEAENQAQTMKEEAYQQGFQEGSRAAEETVLEKHKDCFAQEMAKVTGIAGALQSSYSDLVRKAETSLVRLALDVAKKIIGEESREKENVVRNMIKEGLLRAGEKPVIKIRVNPEQLPSLQAQRSLFEAQSKSNKDFEIISDDSVSSGGCVIETDSGSIDLRIEKQFQEIKESLTGEKKENGTV